MGKHFTREQAVAAFWAKVDKTNGPDKCWIWKGGKHHWGYGSFSFLGQPTTAHRAAYLIGNGEIPDKLHVLHRCDNPSCVNPSHLFLGTNLDNVKDAMSKGRNTLGARNGRAKWTEDDVRRVRAATGTDAEIARELNMPHATIWCMRHGRSWKHVR